MSDSSTIDDAISAITSRTRVRPVVGVILGSGLGRAADEIEGATTIPYEQIPGLPGTTVPGHPGQLVVGTLEGVGVAALKGRPHLYEGYTPAQVGFPVRLLGALGVRVLVVTNAAGGLRPEMEVGTLMVLADHINLPGLAGLSPLVGVAGGEERFVHMVDAYDPALRLVALEAARERGFSATLGVYAMVAGPSYETPAEARLLRQLGADAVGMSTVPEVIVARWLGMRVLGLSCITNVLLGPPASEATGHLGVLSAAEQATSALAFLLRFLLRRLKVEGVVS